jgi:DNA repair protein RadD
MQPELFDFDVPNYASHTFPEPRPFQAGAHDKLRDGARSGHRCQMIMAPTGAGKTYLGMRIIYEALKKGRRAMFVCDRTTLINQTSTVADQYGLSAHGIIQSNHWRYEPRLPFQIASVQTLARRSWPETDIIVIDEAHTQYSAWVEYVKTCSARVIGLSATPFSSGLGQIFSNLVNAATMHDLTQSGVLVPLRVYSCTKANMEGAATAGGEWTYRAAEERGMEIIGDVVAEWAKFAYGKKTIVFGATIKHCEEMARQFNEAGVMASVFTSQTTEAERAMLLEDYRKPDSMIRVLISVEALAKGFDVKDVECVCDCRPLRKSLSTAIQMWGRGLRSSPETGKTECILLDFSGNIIRFAEDFSDIYYHGLDALDMGEKLDKAIRRDKPDEQDGKACPSCGFQPFGRRCISCGFEAQSRSLVEHVPGQMREIMIGKQKAADDAQHLWEQVVTYVRSHGNPEKASGRAWYLFRDIAGFDLPKGLTRFDETPNAVITKPTLNKIKQRNIAFIKSLEKAA